MPLLIQNFLQGVLYEALNMKTFLQQQAEEGTLITSQSHVTTPSPLTSVTPNLTFFSKQTRCNNNGSLNGTLDGGKQMEIPDFTQCVTFGTLSQTGSKIYLLYTMIVQFFIPVVLMIICYVVIIAKLTMKNRRERQGSFEIFSFLIGCQLLLKSRRVYDS